MRLVRLKDLGRWSSGGTPPRDATEHWAGDIPWLSAKDFDSTQQREPTAFITREAAERFSRLTPPGSLLVIVRGMALAHGLPVIQVVEESAFNQDVRGLVCRADALPRFVYYSLIGHRWVLDAHIDRAAHGTARISDSIYSERIPLPDVSVQAEVIDILDAQCPRIDQLTAEIDEFVATATASLGDLVRRAITGIDDGPQTKVSGDWFTSIPRGWSTKPLGVLARFDNGFAFKPEDWGDEGYPIIRIEHLNGAELAHRTTRGVPNRCIVRRDDLLFAWSGNRGTSFGPHRWRGESPALLNQHIFRVTTDQHPQWLYWALRAATLYVEELAHGIIGMVHITKGRLTKIRVPVPPLEKQQEIACVLDDALLRHQHLCAELAELREGLLAYRNSLIAEAVTGRLATPDEQRRAVHATPSLTQVTS